MKITVQLSEQDIKNLILKKFQDEMPNCHVEKKDITILVKSKQNYKSEWESATIKASIERGF